MWEGFLTPIAPIPRRLLRRWDDIFQGQNRGDVAEFAASNLGYGYLRYAATHHLRLYAASATSRKARKPTNASHVYTCAHLLLFFEEILLKNALFAIFFLYGLSVVS